MPVQKVVFSEVTVKSEPVDQEAVSFLVVDINSATSNAMNSDPADVSASLGDVGDISVKAEPL